MADHEKTLQLSFNVDKALKNLARVKSTLSKVEGAAKKSFAKIGAVIVPKQSMEGVAKDLERASAKALAFRASLEKAKQSTSTVWKTTKKSSDVVQKALSEEKTARDRLNAAMKSYDRKVKQSGKEAERATRKAAKEAEKLARSASKAQNKLSGMFLSLGKGSGTLSRMLHSSVAQVGALTAGFIGLHKAISAVGESEERVLRFDELSTSILTATKGAEDNFESVFSYGEKGAKNFQNALREAALSSSIFSDDFANVALYWQKAGQTNLEAITSLSKVSVDFARSNRDAEGNILGFARASDVLSDLLTSFRMDTSTPDKVKAAAESMSDLVTATTNAANLDVEAAFEFSKKIGPISVEMELLRETSMAAGASLASAGIKGEEAGTHLKRIFTQFSREDVQATFKSLGIELEDEYGKVRDLSLIFGELNERMKDMKPLQRMALAKKLFGQWALTAGLALSGMNEFGAVNEANTLNALRERIQSSVGITQRNREQYLQTTAGRKQKLMATWSNVLDSVLDKTDLVFSALTALEKIDAQKVFLWITDVALPSMRMLADAVVLTYKNIREWLNPVLDILSRLMGSVSINATSLSDAMTTLVQLWLKWKMLLLVIRGMRIVAWFGSLVKTIQAATMSMTALGVASSTMAAGTQAAVSGATSAVSTLPKVFGAVGIAVTAAIAGWGLYDALTAPLRRAEKRIKEFHEKYGEHVGTGVVSTGDINQQIRDLGKDINAAITSDPYMDPDTMYRLTQKDRERKAYLESLRNRQYKQENRYDWSRSSSQEPFDYKNAWQSLPDAARSMSIKELKGRFDASKLGGDQRSIISAMRDAREGIEYAIGSNEDQIISMEEERRALLTQQLGLMKEGLDADDSTEAEIKRVTERIEALYDQNQDHYAYLRQMDAQAIQREATRAKAFNIKEEQKNKKAGRGRKRPRYGDDNPFAPLYHGLDEHGRRIINLALGKTSASNYLKEDPRNFDRFKKTMMQQKSVINFAGGPTNYSLVVNAKGDMQQVLDDSVKWLRKQAREDRRRQKSDQEHYIGNSQPIAR